MKRSLFIPTILLLHILCFQAKAQVSVRSLNDSSIAEIPMDRFFYHSPEASASYSGTRACVKTAIALDSLVALMNAYHKTNPVDTLINGVKTIIWPFVKYPIRYYMLHNVVMEVYPKNGFNILAFHNETTYTKRRALFRNRKSPALTQVSKLGAPKEMIDGYQNLLNHINFDAPLRSAFHHGYNQHRFFLSTREREQAGIQEVCEIYQHPNGTTGGMHNNWSLTNITFNPDQVTNSWAPLNRDSSYVFDFEEMTAEPRFLNGTTFEFENGNLIGYGGSGYGSFDWHDIHRVGEFNSIIETRMVGNATSDQVSVAVNYFNRFNQLEYKVDFGSLQENENINFDDPSVDSIIQLALAQGASPDTTLFHYGYEGQIYAIAPTWGQMRKTGQTALKRIEQFEPGSQNLQEAYSFYQLYIGNETMESYFQSYLGYLPNLIEMEIYAQGIFIFKRDDESGKYYFAGDLVLE